MKKENLKIGNTVVFNTLCKNSLGEITKTKGKRVINTIGNLESINNLLKNKEIEILEIY